MKSPLNDSTDFIFEEQGCSYSDIIAHFAVKVPGTPLPHRNSVNKIVKNMCEHYVLVDNALSFLESESYMNYPKLCLQRRAAQLEDMY